MSVFPCFAIHCSPGTPPEQHALYRELRNLISAVSNCRKPTKNHSPSQCRLVYKMPQQRDEQVSKRSERNRRGLPGSTGEQVDGGFVNRPYGAADDEVFIESKSHRGWRRMAQQTAIDLDRRIVLCAECGERAGQDPQPQLPVEYGFLPLREIRD